MTEVRPFDWNRDRCDIGCSDDELAAHVAWSSAKMNLVAASYGLDDEGLARRLDLVADAERERIMAELRFTPVDPATGSGLH